MATNPDLIQELVTNLVGFIHVIDVAESETELAITTIMGSLQDVQVLLEQKVRFFFFYYFFSF